MTNFQKDIKEQDNSSNSLILDSYLAEEFGEIKDFFNDNENRMDSLGPNQNKNKKGVVRSSKRSLKKYLAIAIDEVELSHLKMDSRHPSISSQIGFTVENIRWNEVRNVQKYTSIFDNDFSSYKNIGFKLINLVPKKEDSESKNEIEVYLKINSVKLQFSPLSLTFGYIMSHRLIAQL